MATETTSGSGYGPLYPGNIPIDPSIKEFIARFFTVSDTSGLTDDWVGFFRDDATLVMGNNTAEGQQEIRKLRVRMWNEVSARKHTLEKVFPANFDDAFRMNAAEFMLFGSVTYRRKAELAAPDSEAAEREDLEAKVDWAAHGKLKRDASNAPWGFAYYRVYLQR
ncbi:hypothetical protein OQA88_261 [Cercophora sp. LCS_1]